MATVRVGRGNNGQDGTEGTVYRNAIGCYLHGALLPKNPALSDWLIEAGMRHRYGEAELEPLDDAFERAAHSTAVERAVATR
jgi:CobQ-like glutamine amidotransferase family enzyme